MSREAMQLALEALDSDNPDIQLRAAIALRQALEEKREPVGYFSVNDYGRWEENEGTYGEPLYTAPSKQWVGLTDEDMEALFLNEDGVRFARYIEAKLREKNHG